YLTLKDEEAPLRAVIYRGVALRMRFDLQDGMKVVVRGRLTVYLPRGDYQLQIEEVQPKGIGPLELAFRQLKEKLFARGFFEPARKKKPPRIPRRIVLVTSPTGSAVRDMLEILGRRWPAAEVWVCPVKVQGDGAAEEIADAVHRLNKLHATGAVAIDVLIVGRGGGSLEDLWAFNEEPVAQAIFASCIPVVSGVGHEDDLTIADLVADLRALTPSEAAEKTTPDRAAVLDWLEKQEIRWRGLLMKQLESARARLDDLAGRRCFADPLERVRDEERLLDDWNDRLQRAAAQRLEATQRRLEALAAQLESLSPLNILARGYTLTLREADGAVVRSAAQVRRGDRLVTRVGDGSIVSRVEETTTLSEAPRP
ncbi:MAG TPA: exodeoxyribonuclease VII large subunit, partial [Gemmataceae bacterium]|nr:exodeoxyribonuclease VII large subunit [Gemmataceae bacterium]